MTTPIRRPRVSYEQIEQLTEFLCANPQLARGYGKTKAGRHFCQEKWEEIADILNSVEGGVYKTWKEWYKYWNDYKANIKKKQAAMTKSMEGADATMPPPDMQMSAPEERILYLLAAEPSRIEFHDANKREYCSFYVEMGCFYNKSIAQ